MSVCKSSFFSFSVGPAEIDGKVYVGSADGDVVILKTRQ